MMRSSCVFEVDGVELRLTDAAGVSAVSPAVAVLTGRELVFGDEARRRARLDPRRTFDRFWERLDQEPLARPAGAARNHADLAYFHLQELWQRYTGAADEVLLAVPAGLTRDQLALLLGVTGACELPVTGLIAAPVAAAAAAPGAGTRLVLEADAHRVTAVPVTADDQLRLGQLRTVVRQGLAEFADTWAAAVAARFVHEARFDPLHDAETEQALYDALPDWLAALTTEATVRAELPGGARRYQVELDRAALTDAVSEHYAAITQAAAGADQVLLGPRLAGLPGCAEAVRAACRNPPTILAADATARAVLAHADDIRSDTAAPAFVTRLPAPDAVTGEAAVAAPAPTHLLQDWRAYPIGARALALPPGASASGAHLAKKNGAVRLHSSDGTVRVNGEPASDGAHLAAGDELEIGGQQLRLIVALTGHDPA